VWLNLAPLARIAAMTVLLYHLLDEISQTTIFAGFGNADWQRQIVRYIQTLKQSSNHCNVFSSYG
jgi:hypothetical protein